MFPVIYPRWAQLGAKLSPKVPSCDTLDVTSSSMCITPDRFTPLDPLAPTVRHLGPSWAELGPFGGSPEAGPYPGQFCGFSDTLKICVFSRDRAAHVGRNLRPNLPTLRHIGPRLGSTWAQLEPTGPSSVQVRPQSWTQVGSCSERLKAKDGQV